MRPSNQGPLGATRRPCGRENAAAAQHRCRQTWQSRVTVKHRRLDNTCWLLKLAGTQLTHWDSVLGFWMFLGISLEGTRLHRTSPWHIFLQVIMLKDPSSCTTSQFQGTPTFPSPQLLSTSIYHSPSTSGVSCWIYSWWAGIHGISAIIPVKYPKLFVVPTWVWETSPQL